MIAITEVVNGLEVQTRLLLKSEYYETQLAYFDAETGEYCEVLSMEEIRFYPIECVFELKQSIKDEVKSAFFGKNIDFWGFRGKVNISFFVNHNLTLDDFKQLLWNNRESAYCNMVKEADDKEKERILNYVNNSYNTFYFDKAFYKELR